MVFFRVRCLFLWRQAEELCVFNVLLAFLICHSFMVVRSLFIIIQIRDKKHIKVCKLFPTALNRCFLFKLACSALRLLLSRCCEKCAIGLAALDGIENFGVSARISYEIDFPRVLFWIHVALLLLGLIFLLDRRQLLGVSSRRRRSQTKETFHIVDFGQNNAFYF